SSRIRLHRRAASPSGLFANIRVTADVRLVGNTEARWVGVICRMSLTGGRPRLYGLIIYPATGRFGLGRYDGDRWVHGTPLEFAPVAGPLCSSTVGCGPAP